MAIDCSNVPNNVTYDCANPWGQNCTSDKRFQFTSLWKYTQNIQKACPNDTRLFVPQGGVSSPQNASLTQAACAAIAGSDWKYYPAADTWTRLTTWKFPLLQLVASFPRPPLSISVEAFVILHLLGDPIDTIRSLLAKISTCQTIANEWREECEKLLEKPPGEDEDRDWKALALVIDAYGEWNVAGDVKHVLQQGFHSPDNVEHKKGIASAVRQTGRALAADRSTKFLPIIVAEAFFIGAVGIAVFRTASAAGEQATSDTVFINVEAHSIAFSAQYFWIIPAVFLGSVIGVSQTEAAIPRILRRFEIDLERLNLPSRVELPNDCLKDNEKRIFHGGVYSWQLQGSRLSHNLVSHVIVIMGTASGMIISALVPPDGWDCRHYGEILILVAWLLSVHIGGWLSRRWALDKANHTKLFWCTCFKDLLFTIATMGGIITTQVGVFNKCECYTLWGKTGLALPEMPDVAQTLFDRLNTVYPGIAFTCIGLELVVVPLLICYWYIDALRTYIQRDDRMSNAIWLWKLLKKYRALKAALKRPWLRRLFGLSRTRTGLAEEGRPGDASELQPLTQTASEHTTIGNDHVAEPSTINGPSEPTASNSQSSGVDWPSRSGTDMLSVSDPRRVNTF